MAEYRQSFELLSAAIGEMSEDQLMGAFFINGLEDELGLRPWVSDSDLHTPKKSDTVRYVLVVSSESHPTQVRKSAIKTRDGYYLQLKQKILPIPHLEDLSGL
ncbi:hypothetical protein H6P81_001456 [Aristolochia fimbriata]|uniref:Uncharacterized protein n=1 Tax=Aristolochia fimbriata TaxID=158543 RepID=A0AAV7FBI5_ARIFI|nr:hypothetical protein H6P81_001456 [Aristolochia fimbriata]